MCEPTTLAIMMAATTAVSAGLQYSAANGAAKAEASAIQSNQQAAYQAGQEQDRAADAQAFEQNTDRARAASRQLSMARVVAAEGGGSLAARAININASAAEDMSRIDASDAATHATVAGQMAAGQVATAAQLQAVANKSKANQISFFSTVANGAMSAGSSYYSMTNAEKLAKNYRPGATP